MHEILIHKLSVETGKYEYAFTRKVDFSDACNEAFFREGNPNCLIFFTKEYIFQFDYTQEIGEDWAQEKIRQLIYKFDEPFKIQPAFACFNSDQSKLLMANRTDQIIWIDMVNKREIDLVKEL